MGHQWRSEAISGSLRVPQRFSVAHKRLAYLHNVREDLGHDGALACSRASK